MDLETLLYKHQEVIDEYRSRQELQATQVWCYHTPGCPESEEQKKALSEWIESNADWLRQHEAQYNQAVRIASLKGDITDILKEMKECQTQMISSQHGPDN